LQSFLCSDIAAPVRWCGSSASPAKDVTVGATDRPLEDGDPPRRTLDVASLKALAHPMRAELFRTLQSEPATSAQLADRFDSNTGTVSWHLRQLARYGFIEDVPDRGRGRERWWRARTAGTTLDVREDGIVDDPVALEAARWYARDAMTAVWGRVQHWIDGVERWSETWIGASVLHDVTFEMSPSELLALQRELAEVIDRHRQAARPGPDSRPVQAAFQVFPVGDP
jgi:DNA-binding transcriptional ArsR family regulator